MDIWIRLSYPLFCLPLWHREPIRGKLYHLGYTESTLCILYNKELFHSLGIRIPTSAEDAWSWDEFLNVCHTIQTKTSFPYTFAYWTPGRGLSPKSGEWNSYAGLPFIVQNNGSFFLTIHWRQPLDILTLRLPSLLWIGWANYFINIIIPTWRISVRFSWNFAMSLSLPSAYFQSQKRNSNIGIIPLPHGIKAASPHGSWGLCMSRQTQYPRECCEFIRYVSVCRTSWRSVS